VRITFFIFRDDAAEYLSDWDWIETHPLGASESSVLHMARALRRGGHEVLVTNRAENIPRGCDVFVALRAWEQFARGVRPGALNYLWCTDDVDQSVVGGLADARVAAAAYASVDGAIMVSQYQLARWTTYLHLPAAKAFLTRNGIPAAKFNVSLQQRSPALYYSSTPFRGLDVLLDSWPAIRQAVPAATLHVFSSMKIYGDEDAPAYEALYDRARNLPGVYYHGAQGQIPIREIARQCRVFAYPSTFAETSCVAAMEAMASGCAVAATTLGALAETAAGNLLVPMTADWQASWRDAVTRLLTDDALWHRIASSNLALTPQRDWDVIAAAWLARFAHDHRAKAR
jgi:glycosyltransferase involved in cell wall biosynthesis